jgi:hypothetical protein
MREQTVVLGKLGAADVVAWGRHSHGRVVLEKRVIHFYVVHPDTLQMYCVNCGLNIVQTNYGELAAAAGSRTVNKESEKCCDE